MGTIAPRPLLCVVLGDGDQWIVEAEWQDGSIERIATFKAHFEAVNWIGTHSDMWLQERTLPRTKPTFSSADPCPASPTRNSTSSA